MKVLYLYMYIYVNSMLSCVRNQMSMLFMLNVFLGHCALFKENYPFKEKVLLKESFYNRKTHLHMVNVLR
jgi:hypothetical protein